MEQSPSWKLRSSQLRKEIPRILWKPKVQDRIHKSPPPVPIVSQIDPSHFLRYTYFNGNLHNKMNMIFEKKFFILLHPNF